MRAGAACGVSDGSACVCGSTQISLWCQVTLKRTRHQACHVGAVWHQAGREASPSGLTRRPRKRQHPRLRFGAASLTSSLGAPPPLQPCAATLCGRRSELEHDDSVDESDDEKCALCGSAEDDPGRNDILLCDACGGGFHTRCLQPPLDAVPPGDWFCAGCARQRRKSAVYQARARAERKSRGGPNGRRPKQQNGWLIDMHGEITGACYACKVLRCTAIYSGVGSSRVIAQWFTPLHCAGDCGRQGRWRHCPASRSPSARGACAQPRSYTSTRAYHKLDRTATMGACI